MRMALLDWSRVDASNRLIGEGVTLRPPQAGDFEAWRDLLADGNSYVRAENDAASMIDGYLATRYVIRTGKFKGLRFGAARFLTRLGAGDWGMPPLPARCSASFGSVPPYDSKKESSVAPSPCSAITSGIGLRAVYPVGTYSR